MGILTTKLNNIMFYMCGFIYENYDSFMREYHEWLLLNIKYNNEYNCCFIEHMRDEANYKNVPFVMFGNQQHIFNTLHNYEMIYETESFKEFIIHLLTNEYNQSHVAQGGIFYNQHKGKIEHLNVKSLYDYICENNKNTQYRYDYNIIITLVVWYNIHVGMCFAYFNPLIHLNDYNKEFDLYSFDREEFDEFQRNIIYSNGDEWFEYYAHIEFNIEHYIKNCKTKDIIDKTTKFLEDFRIDGFENEFHEQINASFPELNDNDIKNIMSFLIHYNYIHYYTMYCGTCCLMRNINKESLNRSEYEKTADKYCDEMNVKQNIPSLYDIAKFIIERNEHKLSIVALSLFVWYKIYMKVTNEILDKNSFKCVVID